jgi:hypothetical protein
MDHVNVLQIPGQLSRRIHNYYDFLWERTRCLDRAAFYGELSLPLAKEIALHTYFSIVLQVPMFQNVEGQFLVYLIPRLETVIYLPGDYVVRKVMSRTLHMYAHTHTYIYIYIYAHSFANHYALVLRAPAVSALPPSRAHDPITPLSPSLLPM